MKRALILAVLVAMAAASADAALILYDSFDGVPGELVTSGGIWTESGTQTQRWRFGEGNLAVPAGVNLIAPTGNMMVYESDTENYITSNIRRVRYEFDRVGNAADPRGALYMSYLQYHEVSGVDLNGTDQEREWVGVEAMSQAGGARTTLYAGKANQEALFLVETTSNGNNFRSGADTFPDGEVRFIVVKYEWDLRTMDDERNPLTPWATANVWFNPNCALDEGDNTPFATVNLLAGGTAWQGNGFDRIDINAGSWHNDPPHNFNIVAFDEFRLGTTWDAVTPVPEPGIMLLMASGLVGLYGIRRRRS